MKRPWRQGTCVYEPEVQELMKRLDAKGIMLVVVRGKRNLNDVEFSTSISLEWKQFVVEAFAMTSVKMLTDFEGFNPVAKKAL